jgi:colicin import membrane protein
MKKVIVLFFFLCLGCNTLIAQSQDVASNSDDIEREQLKKDKKTVESSFLVKEADCYKKFSVNACIGKVAVEKNEALTEIKRRELVLNERRREEKSKQYSLKKSKSISQSPGSTGVLNRNNERVDPSKRVDLAKERVESANQKQQTAKMKATHRLEKNKRSAEQAAKYQEKRALAEAHKMSVQKRNSGSTKPTGSSLPIPKSVAN